VSDRRDDWIEGRQSWRDLLFLHWPVEPETVRAVVPPALPLDLRDDKAWLGVVAFGVRAARPPWVPAFLGLDFLETNARTYVRVPGEPPAVFFFSLDASSRLAVAAARARYGLPYHYARMSREVNEPSMLYRTARVSSDAAGAVVRYRTGQELGSAAPGSLDEFLIERYALHTVDGDSIRTIRVRHSSYPLEAVEVELLSETLLAAAGVRRPEEAPVAHFSPGVHVEVRPAASRASHG
jgi:uncharacterized protein YqjF (DUF2071 family)